MTPQRQKRLREQLRRSRARLMVSDPALAMVLMYLRFVATKDVFRISTNGREILFDPDWFQKLGKKETDGNLTHDERGFLTYDETIIDNSDAEDPVFPARFLFKEFDVHSGAFWNWIREEISKSCDNTRLPWNRVVLALPDDLENLRTAKAIEREYKAMGIIDALANREEGGPVGKWRRPLFFAGVRRPANAKYSDDLVQPEEDFWLRTFGNLEDLYANLCGNMEKWNSGAIALNGKYKDVGKTDAEAWRKCSTFDKESSRASVFGMLTAARLLGYKESCAEPIGEESHSAYIVAESLPMPDNDTPQLDILAKVEQLRFNAYHIMRCIRPWIADEKEVENEVRRRHATVKPNDRERHCRHAAITATWKLGTVDGIFAKGNKNAGQDAPDKVADINKKLAENLGIVLKATGWCFFKV